MRKAVRGGRKVWMRSAAVLATAAAVGIGMGVQPASAANVTVQVLAPAGSNWGVQVVPASEVNPSGCIHVTAGEWTDTGVSMATGDSVTVQILDGGNHDACDFNHNRYIANTGPMTVPADMHDGEYWQVNLDDYVS